MKKLCLLPLMCGVMFAMTACGETDVVEKDLPEANAEPYVLATHLVPVDLGDFECAEISIKDNDEAEVLLVEYGNLWENGKNDLGLEDWRSNNNYKLLTLNMTNGDSAVVVEADFSDEQKARLEIDTSFVAEENVEKYVTDDCTVDPTGKYLVYDTDFSIEGMSETQGKGKIAIVDLATGEEKLISEGQYFTGMEKYFSADGNILAYTEGGFKSYVYDVAKAQLNEVAMPTVEDSDLELGGLTADGKNIVVCELGNASRIFVVDVESSEVVAVLENYDEISVMCALEDELILQSYKPSPELIAWNFKTGDIRHICKLETPIDDLKIADDGKTIFAYNQSDDGVVIQSFEF